MGARYEWDSETRGRGDGRTPAQTVTHSHTSELPTGFVGFFLCFFSVGKHTVTEDMRFG